MDFIEINIKRPIIRLMHIIQSAFLDFKLGSPSKDLKLIGVTGTSGKSTTSFMIYHLLNSAGLKVGLISTVGAIAGGKAIDTGLHVTTPDSVDLIKLLKKMKDEGMEYIVIESSSHAIAQGRLGLLSVDYAVYTNIKRDHLDWHKTWENYAKAKAGLINKLKSNGKAIVNKDDEQSFNFLKKYFLNLNKPAENFIEYSQHSEVTNLNESIDSLTFNYKEADFYLNMLGKYNCENALATIKLGELLNIDLKTISKAFSTFKGVKGRMQIMQRSPFMVIVDFAHNADSLEKALKSIRDLNGVQNIITVFGSAGLRDKEKRGKMGEISAKYSNVTVVTSEDPRTESLYKINSEIIEGAKNNGAKLISRFADTIAYKEFMSANKDLKFPLEKSLFAFDEETVNSRYDAIDFAMRIAKKGDVVITEGKGHEESLCFGTTEYPFTDQEAVNKVLKNVN